MRPFNSRIEQALTARAEQGLYRQRAPLAREAKGRVTQQQSYVNFSSNDYLGLAQSPVLLAAWQDGLSRYGAGSGASPLVTGYHSPHRELEAQLADWLGYERALLFNSGFSANQALLFTLLQKGDVLLQDKLNHASLMEAGMLSDATMRRFAHNDPAALARLLSSASDASANTLVVTEGVFSMDGDLAPLAEIHHVASPHALLMVDDAHGCGVLGEQGRGSCDLAGIKPDILVVTFGKAFGMQGAAILCDHAIAEYLIQFARHYIYSTAMPPAQAYALSHACRLIQQDDWRREALNELGELLTETLDPAIPLVVTSTPIKPVVLGESQRALSYADALREQGFWVSAIRPPTVPQHTARLRITLTAAHQVEDVKQLAVAINEVFHRE
ncbi:8-amino-7-oxononanoate synthase [Photobacterium japonica]|uniref:8-amino-7-oxononanoate synthase n=1 Tax=Photobacterium japonica TaxID=2910235 RepID=UPI003D0D14B6